jgi:hypothetical protein
MENVSSLGSNKPSYRLVCLVDSRAAPWTYLFFVLTRDEASERLQVRDKQSWYVVRGAEAKRAGLPELTPSRLGVLKLLAGMV